MFKRFRNPQTVRDYKKVFYLVIFGLICLVFVFFNMMPQSLNGGGDVGTGVAAVVNDTVISILDFKETMEARQRQMGMRFDDLPAAQRKEFTRYLYQQTLNQLIDSEVMYQAARTSGIRVTDSEVGQQIMEIPVFQDNGIFQRSRYDNYLQATQSSPLDFEQKVRKDLVLSRTRNVLAAALKPVKGQVERTLEARGSSVEFKFFQFSDQDLENSVSVSRPEVAAFAASADNAGKIKDYYEGHQEQYTSKEEVKARHLLIKLDAKNKESEEKALEKVKALASKLPEGAKLVEAFSAAARESSEDLGTKAKGGDLGYFAKGMMTPEFERVAFSQPLGQVSAPVKTPFGYHLILVEDRKGGLARSLDQVKLEIAEHLVKQSRLSLVKQELEEALKKQEGAKIEQFAKNHKLKWEETGEVKLDQEQVPKLGEGAPLWAAVLKKAKAEQYLPQVLTVGGKSSVIFLKKIVLRASKGTNSDSELQQLASQSMGEVLSQWLEQVKKQARIERNDSLLTVQ